MAGGDGTIMIFGFHCRWSILLTFTDLMAVAAILEKSQIPSNHNDCDHNECCDQRKGAFEAGPANFTQVFGLSGQNGMPPMAKDRTTLHLLRHHRFWQNR
jgi:hypothetical protein